MDKRRQQLVARLPDLETWHHTIDLGDGITTPIVNVPGTELPNYAQSSLFASISSANDIHPPPALLKTWYVSPSSKGRPALGIDLSPPQKENKSANRCLTPLSVLMGLTILTL